MDILRAKFTLTRVMGRLPGITSVALGYFQSIPYFDYLRWVSREELRVNKD